MAEISGIEWTDGTFNPWIGCTKVSPACDNCYAAVSTPSRTLGVEWGVGQLRHRTSAANWKLPLRWSAGRFWECTACGLRGGDAAFAKASHALPAYPTPTHRKPVPCYETIEPARQRVFCASLADVFDNEVDPQWRIDLFALIRATPNLDWMLLTKRIGNADRMIADAVGALPRDKRCGMGQFNHHPIAQWPWPNVWIGATICNQAEADRDVPKLLRVPAAVRFLSIEPMLGPVNVRWALSRNMAELAAGFLERGSFAPGGETLRRLDWIIAGGESSSHARPSHPDWFRSLRDQCAAARVPFLFKNWGEHSLEYDRDRDDPDWRRCGEWDRKPGRWINLAGGHGFHGERVHYAHRVGKKAAGRQLDGRTHDGYPEVRHA